MTNFKFISLLVSILISAGWFTWRLDRKINRLSATVNSHLDRLDELVDRLDADVKRF